MPLTHAYGTTDQDAAGAGKTLTGALQQHGMNNFHYEVGTDGLQKLMHNGTGSRIPLSYNDFINHTNVQNQAVVARIWHVRCRIDFTKSLTILTTMR